MHLYVYVCICICIRMHPKFNGRGCAARAQDDDDDDTCTIACSFLLLDGWKDIPQRLAFFTSLYLGPKSRTNDNDAFRASTAAVMAPCLMLPTA